MWVGVNRWNINYERGYRVRRVEVGGGGASECGGKKRMIPISKEDTLQSNCTHFHMHMPCCVQLSILSQICLIQIHYGKEY